MTPGLDRTRQKLRSLRFPERLDGMTVLDVGCWDGFFAFEAERRGASRVLATDGPIWRSPAWGRQGFDVARRALASGVEDKELEVLDHTPESVGVFDVVLFLGVLYHMRHPLLALERMASVTGRMLILETHVDLVGRRRPAAAFYPGSELNGDESNWWGPNVPAAIAMLEVAGFSRVDVVYTTPWVGRLARAGRALVGGGRPARVVEQGRAVLHAFR